MFERQKTKIIATLGDPKISREMPSGKIEVTTTYEQGLYDYDQKLINNLSIEKIVDLFLQHGVDVLRINLAHILLADLKPKFKEIKSAILKAERKYNRRVGVLADLPGPKIRFNESDWLIPTDTLSVCFDKTKEELTPKYRDAKKKILNQPPERALAQINLDKKPFAAASKESRKAANSIIKETNAKLNKYRKKGKKLLAFIGDNDCTLEVVAVQSPLILCKIISVRRKDRMVGGAKGFTIRGVSKPIGAFTNQDKLKLSKLLEADFESSGIIDDQRIVSHIGISFCQTREDARKVLHHIVKHLRKERREKRLKRMLPMRDLGGLLVEAPLLIAKIETEEGIKNIDKILDIADGAMIARGDLALEIETEDLPQRAKRLIDHCNLRGKPVIMATQMLESMKETIECTRPEATDVFGAVFDNVDGLMLSGETSSGKYPAHAIEKMRALALNAERFTSYRRLPMYTPGEEEEASGVEDLRIEEDKQIQVYFNKLEKIKIRVKRWQTRWNDIGHEYTDLLINRRITTAEKHFIDDLILIKNERLRKQNSTDRISHAVCMMSVDPAVTGIVAPTVSGRTARMLARFRPRVWILAQPHSQLTARKLTIDRGVIAANILPVVFDSGEVDQLMKESKGKIQIIMKEWQTMAQASLGEKMVVIFTCGTPLGRVGTTNMIQRWELD